MTQITTTETHTFWEEDGIICFSFNKPIIDIDTAHKGLAIRKKITKGKPYLIFLDLKNVMGVTNEAREFYASEEGRDTAIAVAAYTPSNLTWIISTFFLTFNRPTVNFKIFTSKEKAFEWLNECKKELGE